MTRDERVARCVGWLEGFSSTPWALVSTNDGAKLVDPSACDEYDKVVKELRETLCDSPITDTGPFEVNMVPLEPKPIELTPKVALTAGDGE